MVQFDYARGTGHAMNMTSMTHGLWAPPSGTQGSLCTPTDAWRRDDCKAAAAKFAEAEAQAAKGAGRQGQGQGQAAQQAHAVHSFDVQKHGAVHDLLRLLGMPAPAAPPAGFGAPDQQGGGGPKQQGQVFGGPARHPGSGAALILAAALLGQEAATQAKPGSGSGTGTGRGTHGVAGAAWGGLSVGSHMAGNASAVLALFGPHHPVALQAAHQLAPLLKEQVLCSGTAGRGSSSAGSSAAGGSTREVRDAGGGVSGERRGAEGCPEPAGCLALWELQVLGEAELEMTFRGSMYPVPPFMVSAAEWVGASAACHADAFHSQSSQKKNGRAGGSCRVSVHIAKGSTTISSTWSTDHLQLGQSCSTAPAGCALHEPGCPI